MLNAESILELFTGEEFELVKLKKALRVKVRMGYRGWNHLP